MTNNTINQSGPIPSFFAYQDAPTANYLNTGNKVVLFNTVYYDTSSSYSTVSNEYIIPETGGYFFTTTVLYINVHANNITNGLGIENVGKTVHYVNNNIAVLRDNNNKCSKTSTVLFKAVAGDRIRVLTSSIVGTAFGTDGDAINNPKTWFSGYFIPEL